MVFDMRRPDRRTPMKVLVQKSFRFVDKIWEMFVLHNSEDTGYVQWRSQGWARWGKAPPNCPGAQANL